MDKQHLKLNILNKWYEKAIKNKKKKMPKYQFYFIENAWEFFYIIRLKHSKILKNKSYASLS